MTESQETNSMKVSIIIPAFNDALVISNTLNAIKKVIPEDQAYEIIVVDDGSADSTAHIAKRAGAKVLRPVRERGYGNAIQTAFEQVTGDVIVLTDADLNFNPEDIPKLVEKTKHYDLVIGSRFLESSRKSEKIPFFKVLYGKLYTLLIYFLFKVKVTDLQSGFRAFNKDILDEIRLESSDYSINSEMVRKAAKKGFKILEVPVLYRDWRRL